MTTDEEIRRANDAQRLMNEPMIAEAFALVEQGVIDAIKASKLGDEKTHTKLAMMLQVVGAVRAHFKTTMETGKMARIQKETLAEKAVRLVSRR